MSFLLGIILIGRFTLYLKVEHMAHFIFRIYTIIYPLSDQSRPKIGVNSNLGLDCLPWDWTRNRISHKKITAGLRKIPLPIPACFPSRGYGLAF